MSNTRHVEIEYNKDGNPTFIPFYSQQASPFAAQWQFLIAEQVNTGIDCVELKKFLLEKEKEVLNIEPNTYNDGGTKLGKNSTTSRFLYYNVLTWDHPEISKLKKQIYKLYYQYVFHCFPEHKIGAKDFNGVTAGCWMNVMRKGERIVKHQHGYHPTGFLTGHFCVSCSNTSTVYVNPYEHSAESLLIKEAEDLQGQSKSKLVYNVGETDNDGERIFVSANGSGKLTLFPTFIPHFTTKHLEDTERITLAFDLRPRYDNQIPLIDRPICNWDNNKQEYILDETIFQD